MPILQNAKKALRVSKRKAVFNRSVKSRVKSAMDSMRKKPSAEALAVAYKAIDTSVKKNILHKNKAARLKAQLSKLVKPAKLAAKSAKKAAAKPAKKKSSSKK